MNSKKPMQTGKRKSHEKKHNGSIKNKKKAISKLRFTNLPEKQKFWLANGEKIGNLVELLKKLKIMPDSVFSYHVNGSKNDFTNWIRNVLKEKKLSKILEPLKDKRTFMFALEGWLNQITKGPIYIPERKGKINKSSRSQIAVEQNKLKKKIKQKKNSKLFGVKKIYNTNLPRKEKIIDKKEQKIYSANTTGLIKQRDMQVYNLGSEQKSQAETTKKEYLNDNTRESEKKAAVYRTPNNEKNQKSHEEINKKEIILSSGNSKCFILKSKPIMPNVKFLKINISVEKNLASANNDDQNKNAAYGIRQTIIAENNINPSNPLQEIKKTNSPINIVPTKEKLGKYTAIKRVKLRPDREFINKLKRDMPFRNTFNINEAVIQKPARVQQNEINSCKNNSYVESNTANQIKNLTKENDLLVSQVNKSENKTTNFSHESGFNRHDILIKEPEKRKFEIMSMLKHLDDTEREINVKRARMKTIEYELSKKEFEIAKQERMIKQKRQMLEENLIIHLIGTNNARSIENKKTENIYKDMLEEYLEKLKKIYSQKDLDGAKKIIEDIKLILGKNDLRMEFQHDYYQKVLEIKSDVKKD